MQKRETRLQSIKQDPSKYISVQTLAAAIYAAETAKLLQSINALLQQMSQKVATIDSLVRLLPSAQDVEEVRLKMEETTALLDQLLPLVHRLMTTPEPKTPGANTYWWLERERINREFEQILRRFRAMHEFLSRGKMTAIPMKTLEKMMAYEMELTRKIREVCEKTLPPPIPIDSHLPRPAISIVLDEVLDEVISPSRSRSMDPEEFKNSLLPGGMKRSATRNSVRSVRSTRSTSSGKRHRERRNACVIS